MDLEPGLSLELWPRFNPGAERVLSGAGRESVNALVAQSRLTLCDPMECSLPGSSVHGIFQAKVLERVAISFSRGSSQSRDRTLVSRIASRCFSKQTLYHLGLQGSPTDRRKTSKKKKEKNKEEETLQN